MAGDFEKPAPAIGDPNDKTLQPGDALLDKALSWARENHGHGTRPGEVMALVREIDRLRLLREWLISSVERDGLTRQPMRFGESLPQCAGGLAYFSFMEMELGPARTVEEAIDASLALFIEDRA